MLSALHIENIAVISSVDIELDRGLSVLSGETGAGKSIIIDGINMLLGNRVSKELVRRGCDKATVTGVFESIDPRALEAIARLGFELEDDSLMIQCTLTREGKSTAKLNGIPITKTIQREITRCLISIHGQNDNQRLLQKSYHTTLLDSFAELEAALSEYRERYDALVSARRELERIAVDESERIRRIEMLRFQLSDIGTIPLKPDTEDVLERESRRLQSLERINKQTRFAYRVLFGSDKGASAYYILDRAAAALSGIRDAIPELDGYIERLNEMKYEVEDIARTVEAYSDDCDEDPTERLNKVESALNAISRLKRKYGQSVAMILEYRDKAKKELEELENSAERTGELEAVIRSLEKKARQQAHEISTLRTEAAKRLEAAVMESLAFLDMPNVRFKVSIKPTDQLSADGCDDIEFLIATNKGDDPMPLIKIASGGELSRIMLALKSVLSNKDNIGTVIYDEVDTGISGSTSQRVGIKLKHAASSVQVICVTHSAQIASLAHSHYLISKSDTDTDTQTAVTLLDKEGRIGEVARILGGINVTDAQRRAAEEMINEGINY